MISLCLLTFNRENTVQRAVSQNLDTAGRGYDEVIYCDNGSTDNVREVVERLLSPDVRIYNKENLGTSKGYNRTLALATKKWVLITGCDRLLPAGWLKTLLDHIEAIPNTGVISIYAHPIEKTPERIRGPVETVDGKVIQRAMPMGARIMRRSILKKAGYMHEGFGLYGFDDVVWGHTIEKVCKEHDLLSYVIPSMISQHLGDTGVAETHQGYDCHEYWRFKQKEVREPYKQELLKKLAEEGHPPFWPY